MKNKKPRIALIATYPKMAEMFMSMAAKSGIDASSVDASFEDAVKVAKSMEGRVDAILSRGGTGRMLKAHIKKPVVNIPITPFDVLKGLNEIAGSGLTRVGFIHAEYIGNVKDVEEMTGIKLEEYFFDTKEDIKEAVEDILRKGINVVIGGHVGTKVAEEHGLRGIEISAGEDAMQIAIREVLQILTFNEAERSKAARIREAFDSVTEGIIVTDKLQRITIANKRAREIFRKPDIKVNDYRTVDYDRVFAGDMEESSRLSNHFGTTIAVSHRRIVNDGIFEGVLTKFEDVRKIQKMEKKIRWELLDKGFVAKYSFEDIISVSSAIDDVKRQAKLYAASDASILIQGESGTGKELFAQSIHSASRRAAGPFVAVNCAAIPPNLIESELFGYEPGAFTGARKEGKAGLFEIAHEGTIFLDEIGELPVEMQARILRVLQEKEVMRIGGDKIIPVNIRVISATNQDLLSMIEEKTFREDLYYRLNVFNIKIPSLRKRKQDVSPLLRHFLSRMGADIEESRLTRIIDEMTMYEWPGNIRELQNVAERIAVLSELVEFDDLVKSGDSAALTGLLGIGETGKKPAGGIQFSLDNGLKGAVEEFERHIINELLAEYGNDQDAVADRLKIGRTTLWRKSK